MGLPEIIYVKEEEDADETYLVAGYKPEDIVGAPPESWPCGIYELKETGTVTAAATFDK